MKHFLIIFILSLTIEHGWTFGIYSYNVTFVQSRFIENAIVTDLNLVNGPPAFLQIVYPPNIAVYMGSILPTSITKNPPRLRWGPIARDGLYAILMTDPDAPTRSNPQFREFRHWFVVNVPSNRSSRGDVIYEYLPPAPPEGTGFHRYIFLIFQQNGIIDVTDTQRFDASSFDGRANTITKDLMADYGFNAPLYGNFFQAQYSG